MPIANRNGQNVNQSREPAVGHPTCLLPGAAAAPETSLVHHLQGCPVTRPWLPRAVQQTAAVLLAAHPRRRRGCGVRGMGAEQPAASSHHGRVLPSTSPSLPQKAQPPHPPARQPADHTPGQPPGCVHSPGPAPSTLLDLLAPGQPRGAPGQPPGCVHSPGAAPVHFSICPS